MNNTLQSESIFKKSETYPKKRLATRAFSLMELMVAALILAIVLVGLLASYVACFNLNEMAQNSSLAINAAETKTEEIKNFSNFDQIKTTYHNVSFSLSSLTGAGVSYVDDTNPDLLQVTVTVCWQQKNGRVIGEDLDLDGQLDTGEDINSNGVLDSPAQVVTYLARQ
jgi:prepilin-type N-terminal cleavage/methylation domain-containing protein